MARTDNPDLRATRRALKTKDGKGLLRYLDTMYKPKMPLFPKNPDGITPMDPYEAAVRSGQNDVIFFLESQQESPENDDE